MINAVLHFGIIFLNSIIGAPFVDNRAKLDSLKNMMPAPSLGAEQCNLIGWSMRANIDSLKNKTPAHLLVDKTTSWFAGLIHAMMGNIQQK